MLAVPIVFCCHCFAYCSSFCLLQFILLIVVRFAYCGYYAYCSYWTCCSYFAYCLYDACFPLISVHLFYLLPCPALKAVPSCNAVTYRNMDGFGPVGLTAHCAMTLPASGSVAACRTRKQKDRYLLLRATAVRGSHSVRVSRPISAAVGSWLPSGTALQWRRGDLPVAVLAGSREQDFLPADLVVDASFPPSLSHPSDSPPESRRFAAR